MSKDNVISLENPEGNADVLTSLLRSGARELISKAVQTELTEFLSQYQGMTDNQGRPFGSAQRLPASKGAHDGHRPSRYQGS